MLSRRDFLLGTAATALVLALGGPVRGRRRVRLGVAIESCIHPDPAVTLPALDEWMRKAGKPDLFPIWVRGLVLDPKDRAVIAGIRARGIRPLLYVEAPASFAVDSMSRIAHRAGDGTVVRFNQEPNGRWGAPWQVWEPSRYIDVFSDVSRRMRAEANVRMWYCPQGRQRPGIDELQTYYPGDAAQIVGFDMYSHDEDSRFPRDQWARSIEWCRATGKPVWVGETGRRNGLTRRAEWLRSIPDAGVDAAIVMDMLALRPDGGHDDWTWSSAMRRSFRELVAVE
jgi:hypothetical protein